MTKQWHVVTRQFQYQNGDGVIREHQDFLVGVRYPVGENGRCLPNPQPATWVPNVEDASMWDDAESAAIVARCTRDTMARAVLHPVQW